jgi:hypothetical protein
MKNLKSRNMTSVGLFYGTDSGIGWDGMIVSYGSKANLVMDKLLGHSPLGSGIVITSPAYGWVDTWDHSTCTLRNFCFAETTS